MPVDIVTTLYGRQERSWQLQANCMGVDPDLFFPERGASTREAKEVCRGCVVREDCLEYALALARRMLAHQHGTKQIIVVTDGEPTAHIDDYGEVTFNYPPIPETLRRTMAEVIRCTRAGIVINTFALDLQRTHYPFVEQIARVNGGRTFYTTPDALGGYVLVDFLQHRRVLRPAG